MTTSTHTQSTPPQAPSGAKQGQGTAVPKPNQTNSNSTQPPMAQIAESKSDQAIIPMIHGKVTESKPSLPESLLFRQGTNHFKTLNLREALYMLASTQQLISTLAENQTEDHPPALAEILANSKLPLFQIEDEKQTHICHPDELLPLSNLMTKTDTAVRTKLENLITKIGKRNNDNT